MIAAKRGYATYSTTIGFNRVSHRWGGRECTDPKIQWGRARLDTSTPDPDTTPTLPQHPDSPTTVSTDTRSDTQTPVSGQCQAISTVDLLLGQCQAVSIVSRQNRHPRQPRHPDTTGLDADMGHTHTVPRIPRDLESRSTT
eukprot:scaffold47081_cov64-Phaeocystis_antarctica.AAC.5